MRVHGVHLHIVGSRRGGRRRRRGGRTLGGRGCRRKVGSCLDGRCTYRVASIAIKRASMAVRKSCANRNAFFLNRVPPFISVFGARGVRFGVPLSRGSFSVRLSHCIAIKSFGCSHLLSG